MKLPMVLILIGLFTMLLGAGTLFLPLIPFGFLGVLAGVVLGISRVIRQSLLTVLLLALLGTAACATGSPSTVRDLKACYDIGIYDAQACEAAYGSGRLP